MTANIGEARQPQIWMYHSIAEYTHDPNLVTVRPERLDRQLRWLRSRGLRGVSVGELIDAIESGNPTDSMVGLTFDDGYADFIHNAAPLLRLHGFNATVFALAGRIGGHNGWDSDPPRSAPRKELLTADQLREVARMEFEIGSHGWRHVSLPAADDHELSDEIDRSRRDLEKVLDAPVNGFCYAYGDVDARVVDAVRAAGYRYACAISPTDSPARYALGRDYIGQRDDAPRLVAKRIRHRIFRARRRNT